MKTLLLFLLVFSFSANADWTKKDTLLEAAYLALWVVDWGQTLYIAESPEFHETNIFLGENPTRGEVNRYFFSAAFLHIGAAYILPRKWRAPFQYISISMQLAQVGRNASVGVKLNF